MRSLSMLKKGIIISLLFCMINIALSYIYLMNTMKSERQFIASALQHTYAWNKMNQIEGDKIFRAYNLGSLVVSEGKTIYYTKQKSASKKQSIFENKIFESIFHLDGHFVSVNVAVDYTINANSIITNYLWFIFTSSLLLVVLAFYISKQTTTNATKVIHTLKENILHKRYDNIPFEDLRNQLQNQDKKYKEQLDNATKRIAHLENASNYDELTNLNNRQAFRIAFNKTLKRVPSAKPNFLAIIRASEIAVVNNERGYQMGDKYIRDVAGMLKTAINRIPKAQAYRIAGGDFAVLIANIEENVPNLFYSELHMQISAYQKANNLTGVCYCGFTIYKQNEVAEEILSRADLALAKAQTGPVNGYVLQTESTQGFLQGEIHWRETVLDIINRRTLRLYYQPIKSMNISITPYVEIFSRFVSREGDELSTEHVLAAAMRHDLLVKLEEMIIDTIISRYLALKDHTFRIGINLTANALISTSFLLWLERTLLRVPEVTKNMVFEVDETVLASNLVGAERLFSLLNRTGAYTSISHFGRGLDSFKLYHELRPNYIKLDPNLSQNFDKELTTQQFIRMIIEVSHRLGCVVIAEGVEDSTQRTNLETLYVDAIQGYLIARPEEFPQSGGSIKQINSFDRKTILPLTEELD